MMKRDECSTRPLDVTCCFLRLPACKYKSETKRVKGRVRSKRLDKKKNGRLKEPRKANKRILMPYHCLQASSCHHTRVYRPDSDIEFSSLRTTNAPRKRGLVFARPFGNFIDSPTDKHDAFMQEQQRWVAYKLVRKSQRSCCFNSCCPATEVPACWRGPSKHSTQISSSQVSGFKTREDRGR
ncbi:hypothetical protein B0T09DRAFT_161157 [Sordaria sp. MPI-SDFR-AT-0083]|nr:hypothetical protein B0T09DRAFT_161157 [Sordaria sp. MPI-SDFR-AT-0083]